MAPLQPYGTNRADDIAFLREWGRANIDAQVWTGKISSTSDVQKQHWDGRASCMAAHHKYGNITFVCHGAKWSFPASIAAQTSDAVSEHIERLEKEGKSFPDIPIEIFDSDMHPYIIDRLVKYYWDLGLTIDSTSKNIEYAYVLPTDPVQTDANMGILKILVRMYILSIDLKDTFLAKCVLAKLRFSLHHGHFDLEELLVSLEQVYGLNGENPSHKLIQSLFLTAALKHSLALSTSHKRTCFIILQGKIERLRYEYTLGMSWNVHV
ncbi:hypothetical protein HBI39_057070 [Parastagonospora nodorum]|nr:hypothetical protein HBI39_057070 [Parastagonospora nodorum]